jgi:predicted nucleotidyltransferase
MRTAGIIVEYNPLHNGHVYHYEQTIRQAEADAVIAVMSGHFLQRGEPALVNKWARAEMALRMGADVVIELPVAFSSQPAEWFAFGAVSALHATGVVDVLCFGSESGNIEQLSDAAKRLANEPERLKIQLKHHLKLGMNYPAAYAKAAQSVLSASEHHDTYEEPLTAEDLAKPNNTLGLHYLIALHKLQSPIKPLTITRTKAGYNDKTATDAHIASATAIRTRLLEERRLEGAAAYMPSYTREILQREWQAGRAPVDWERLALPLYYALLRSSPDELVQIAEVSEGLEHRLLRAAASITDQWSVEQLIAALKTKRYTRTKLQRVLTRLLLGHRKDMLDKHILSRGVPYLRVLGFTQTGRTLLKRMKKRASVPIITNVGRQVDPLLTLDIQATSIYSLAYQHVHSREALRDYYEKPLFLE